MSESNGRAKTHVIPQNLESVSSTPYVPLPQHVLTNETKANGRVANAQPSVPALIGASAQMEEIRDRIRKISHRAILPVLIQGETGTGKEVVAHHLHHSSPTRREGKLVTVNCSAISETLFESELFGYVKGAFTGAGSFKPGLVEEANRGTLFLDEINTLKPELQAKLLRVLQDGSFMPVGTNKPRCVDLWTIAASNKDLLSLVKRGEFREDLFYRINGFVISIPPLRERVDDIIPLAQHFLRQFLDSGLPTAQLSSEVQRCLLEYSWSGNVRELQRMIGRALVSADGGEIQLRHFPFCENQFTSQKPIGPLCLAEVEEKHILKVYRWTDSNKKRTARLLGIGLRTLKRKLAEYGIDG